MSSSSVPQMQISAYQNRHNATSAIAKPNNVLVAPLNQQINCPYSAVGGNPLSANVNPMRNAAVQGNEMTCNALYRNPISGARIRDNALPTVPSLANWDPMRTSTPVAVFHTDNDCRAMKSNEIQRREQQRKGELLARLKNSAAKRKRPRKLSLEQQALRHPLLSPCHCRMNCSEQIDDATRRAIHRSFWSRSWTARQDYLGRFCDYTYCQKSNKRNRPTQNAARRNVRGKFYLPDVNGRKIQVCQRMFLKTLGARSDSLLYAYRRDHKAHCLQPILHDPRGRPTVASAARLSIVEHINSFNPQVAHYRRLHAPMRRYLDSSLSIRLMWRMYNSRFPRICYETYQRVFNRARITFGVPKQDLCDICVAGKFHISEPHTIPKAECQDCLRLANHEGFAALARTEYQDDKSSPVPPFTERYSVDMQKVLLLPILPTKATFFVSRLVCFNETFASLDRGPSFAVLWHEALSGRNTSDVTSSYYRLIRERCPPARHFLFWADNCTAQNKNWTIFRAFVQIVNSAAGPDTITIKFLERGHTYMSADSIHASISTRLKAQSKVEDFQQLLSMIPLSRRNLKVIPMEISDFHDWTPLEKTKLTNFPKLHDIRMARFEKGSRTFQYKLRLDQQKLSSRPVGLANLTGEFPVPRSVVRGLNEGKKRAICSSLLPLIMPIHRDFWYSIPAVAKPDLLKSQL